MFKLSDLPYKYDALEPHIDKTTMEIHHTKHHQAYVDNLNKALEGNGDLMELSAREILSRHATIPEKIRQAVINNAGGHENHTFFWEIMSPQKSEPSGNILEAINNKFNSVQSFMDEFTQKALAVFGSGWAFLILSKDKGIKIKRHSFQNSPHMQGNIPLLGIDVWEHAYYLKYQNKRADYIKAWWNIVNWNKVEENYKKALEELK